jgi:hypothetical protein
MLLLSLFMMNPNALFSSIAAIALTLAVGCLAPSDGQRNPAKNAPCTPAPQASHCDAQPAPCSQPKPDARRAIPDALLEYDAAPAYRDADTKPSDHGTGSSNAVPAQSVGG